MEPIAKPTVKRTQAERTEISDQRMFEATIRLLLQYGPIDTPLTEVGLHAGYSRGLAGNRFGSKDRLFAFTVRRLGEMWLSQLTTATQGRVGLNAIELAISQHYRFCAEAPDHVRTFYMLWFESINAQNELSATVQGIHQRRFQDVVDWIINDPSIADTLKREAESIAAQFSATVIGIVYYWLANPQKLAEVERMHQGLSNTMQALLRDKPA